MGAQRTLFQVVVYIWSDILSSMSDLKLLLNHFSVELKLLNCTQFKSDVSPRSNTQL